MKKTFLSLLAISLALPTMAVIARKGTYTITQSDGNTIEVIKIGDERSHIYITTDGIPVGRTDSSQDFHYLTPSGLSSIKAHDKADRTAAEESFLKDNAQNLSGEKILRSRASASRKMSASSMPKVSTAL